MISIFPLKLFWILFIVKGIVAEECVQKTACECNYEDGFGYDLNVLSTKNLETSNTSSPGIQYIFRPCMDSTTLPDHNYTNNECNPGFAVIH